MGISLVKMCHKECYILNLFSDLAWNDSYICLPIRNYISPAISHLLDITSTAHMPIVEFDAATRLHATIPGMCHQHHLPSLTGGVERFILTVFIIWVYASLEFGNE